MLKEEGHELIVITARGAISNQKEGASIAAQNWKMKELNLINTIGNKKKK